MSQTLDQIYIANPATSLISTDLIYLSRSPYTSGNDFGITAANFITSTNALNWAANANASITAAVGHGYILTHGTATTVALPTVFAVGTMIGVAGQGSSWTLTIGASTNIIMLGQTYTTSLASANNSDSIVLIATVANTTWSPLSTVTSGFTAS